MSRRYTEEEGRNFWATLWFAIRSLFAAFKS